MNNGKNIPLEAYITSLKTGENDLPTAYPGGLIGIGLSIDPSLSKEDRLVGNYLVSPDDESNRIFNTITVSYKEYDGELKLKVNEIAICMLGSIKRSIKILNINTQAKKIKLVSSVNMAGDIDDSLIILSKANNSIQLYGKITDIHN
jgi:translation initiation factor 2 subunit 3